MTGTNHTAQQYWRLLVLPVAALVSLVPPLPAESPELHVIARPDLSEMEPQVREQFRESLQALDEILTNKGVSDAELAEVFGGTGQLFMLYDFVDSAEQCFLNAVALAPNEFRWLYYLGVVQEGQGELEQAIATLERALQIRPEDLPSLIRTAQIELDNIRLEQAETRFQQVLALDPGNAAAHYGLGRIAMLREDFPGAITHFEEALARQVQASTAHYQLGLAYREIGNMDKARTHLARQGRTEVEFEDPLMQELRELVRGSSLFVVGATRAKAAGEWEEAVTLFKLALAADPNNNAARLALATTYMQSGEVEAATRELQQALMLDPENLAGHYNLGTILAQQGQTAAAIAHLEHAIAIDPELEIAHINLAVILARQGDLDEAEHHYAQALRVQPDDLEARQQRAQLLLRLERVDEAIAELEWLAREQPKSVDTQVELARALGTAGRYGDAADTFGRALQMAPGDIELQYARGLALLFSERYAEARDHLEESVRQSPQSLPLRHLLARFLATSPEASLRDGRRALQMAQEVMRAQPIPEYAETVAMAFAETEQFDQAASVQQQIITRVGANTDPATAERFRRHLELYEKHQPVRAPWLVRRP
jgi:tetratricopeptide (TPR) repeat protein